MSTEYKNILINALVNLGDVVLTTAALDLIKKFFGKKFEFKRSCDFCPLNIKIF